MKKKKHSWVPVVTGLIRKDNKALIGLRPEGGNLPGVWEFPGGKLEAGESPEEALHRELLEELGIKVEVGDLKFAATHDYGEVGILLMFYQIKYWKGEPKAKHHTELKWIDIEKIGDLELPEANRKVLYRILSALNNV